ncbi:hypothetical protein DYBT9275_02854 [Dyadobacter sp. CECT 9275]|uniref:Uncharacterized protein n=1 Tax=Dyadobacter helix TaxID=2822344 RepID=A0A916N4T8_9BACT|nr:hypothetical protein [Dyadobacter sp. CECT 9275]CAG5002270.1 hypothetical protein DYBT9275_02854 [Dyadobacter sp. CECT 9275]
MVPDSFITTGTPARSRIAEVISQVILKTVIIAIISDVDLPFFGGGGM